MATEGVAGVLAQEGRRDALMVPLRSVGQVSGSLVVADRLSAVAPFTSADVSSLQSLANHAAVALENSVRADLIVSFGGLPLKNSQAQHGGQGRHALRGWLERSADRGTRFVNVSPVRDDLVASVGAEWLPARPGSDVALMLGLIHTLIECDLADEDFLTDYCVGWEQLSAYVVGESDGVAKTAEWAAGLSEVPAERIRRLAAEMAEARSLVTASWSLQRAEHGEQPYWTAVALAAALGQIGLPGGGFGLGYAAIGSVGNGVKRLSLPALPVPPNPIDSFIPVSYFW